MKDFHPVSSVEQEMKRQPWEPAGVISVDNKSIEYSDAENPDGKGGIHDLEVGKMLRKSPPQNS